MKKYILFAGVNGSGKSTLYQVQHNISDMPRVNADEILRDFGDWKNAEDLLKAGKIAVKMVNDYLKGGVSFNQESTLCGSRFCGNCKEENCPTSVQRWAWFVR